MVGDTFWNYGFCFILLCYKEAAKIFIHIEILVKIFPDSTCMERLLFAIPFCPSSDTRKAINSHLNKVFIDTTIGKFKLARNRTFIKGIFYFLKTVLFFDIFKDLIFKFFFYLRILQLKYPLPLVQIYLLDHLPVHVLEDHWAVHIFYC